MSTLPADIAEKAPGVSPVQARVSSKWEFTIAVGAAAAPALINCLSQVVYGTLSMNEAFYWGTLLAGAATKFFAPGNSTSERFGSAVMLGSVVPVAMNEAFMEDSLATAIAVALIGTVAAGQSTTLSKKLRMTVFAGMMAGGIMGGAIQVETAKLFERVRTQGFLEYFDRMHPDTAMPAKPKPGI